MMHSSMRRVVVAAAAPQAPVAVASSLSPPTPRSAAAVSATATTTYGVPYRPGGYQRRYSSSKPSSPDDGSRDYASRPSVPASGSSKATGEKRKRKAKEAVPRLPSVPSTRHIKDEALALSTFFALHRPISVTQLLPKTVTNESFAEIFSQRPRGHKASEVLSTLSQAVHDLEQPLNKLSLSDKQAEASVDADDRTAKLQLYHADGSETNINFQLNSMSGHFLPFTPPPPPEPISEVSTAEEAAAAGAEEATAAAVEQEGPQTRIYRAMVTIEETVDASGEYKVVAHSPQLVEEAEEGTVARPSSLLQRLAMRQGRRAGVIHALSVQRIRKLKMKKKKYKRLRKRTRNERRKQDRL